MKKARLVRGGAATSALVGWATKLSAIAVVGLMLHLWTGSAMAKTEYRDITWAFCIYDCSYSGDSDTAEGALAANNAAIDSNYDACLASPRGGECGSGCYKINRYDLAPTGGFTIINGVSTHQGTQRNVATTFTPACGARQASTYVQEISGGIAVSGKISCDAVNGWGGQVTSMSTVIVQGAQTPSHQMSCTKEIPDPPSCPKPTFGDPISPIDGTQLESVVDYVDARGALALRRHYTSAGGGRWVWGDASVSLVDFTGRTASAPIDLPSVSGHVMLRPPGMYWSGPLPALQPRLRTFALKKVQPDAGQQEVWLSFADGARERYLETSANQFRSTPYDGRTISFTGEGSAPWTVKDERAGFLAFDATGSIISRTSPTGSSITFSRTATSLTMTHAESGRALVLNRSSTGGFASAVLPDGQAIAYQLGDGARIDAVTYADTSTRQYVYNEAANTATSKSTPILLTGLIDENGARTATFRYDGGGTAVSTERAGGLDKYVVGYNRWAGGGSGVVTFPNQSSSTITWGLGPDGERRLGSQTQPAGSGCSASSKSISYDANGNVEVENDFNGNRVCRSHDLSRNLETVRVSGLSPSQSCGAVTPGGAVLPSSSRKVSKQWHPDWRLAAKVAEPGRMTTSVYNGQPDPFNANAIASCAPADALLPDGKPIAVLCRQVEQATTDANGSQGFGAALQAGVANREQRWTYNRWGQVLTHDGARADVNDVTTYAYYSDTSFTGTGSAAVGHTMGDLQSSTNAVGQVTQYTQYNKHGQPLESVDPNGVVTSHTYDLRQRLLGTTVAGQTTSYTYDAAGQLLRVTRPDASYIGYEYDPAHRQTAVYDSLGNRIEYTLDSAGNRVAENVKDAGGALRRQLARSIDALGRVQQTTGRE